MSEETSINRRGYLAGSASVFAALAGCSGGDEDSGSDVGETPPSESTSHPTDSEQEDVEIPNKLTVENVDRFLENNKELENFRFVLYRGTEAYENTLASVVNFDHGDLQGELYLRGESKDELDKVYEFETNDDRIIEGKVIDKAGNSPNISFEISKNENYEDRVRTMIQELSRIENLRNLCLNTDIHPEVDGPKDAVSLQPLEDPVRKTGDRDGNELAFYELDTYNDSEFFNRHDRVTGDLTDFLAQATIDIHTGEFAAYGNEYHRNNSVFGFNSSLAPGQAEISEPDF